jgi:hypothetical protein
MSAYEREVFEVKRDPEGDDQWHVRLPHQCDYWDVVGESYGSAPHAQAVAELEQFIARAQGALEVLKARREQGHDDEWWLPE